MLKTIDIIFDDNVLSVICLHIDDPKTFAAFSIACKKTNKISKFHLNQKMDQFAITISDVGTGGALIITSYRYLPNGSSHGIESFDSYYQNLRELELKLYHKGYLLAKYNMKQKEIDDDGNDNIMIDETRVLKLFDVEIYAEDIIIEKLNKELKLFNATPGFTEIEYILNGDKILQIFCPGTY